MGSLLRGLFRRPLVRLKAFFLADLSARVEKIEHISVQLRDAEANLAALLHHLRAEVIPFLQRAELSLENLEPRLTEQLRGIETNRTVQTAAQWDAIEQLLLALFRLPESQLTSPGENADSPESPYSKAIELNQVHAAGNLR
jgi:hypothetical protein